MIGIIGMDNKYFFWKNIWDLKGSNDSFDLLYLDGYEHLDIDFDSSQIVRQIVQVCDIGQSDTILEIGCGAGFLSREMQNHTYCGIDYSEPLISKHKEIFPNHDVAVSEANNLPFGDASFDVVFCFGVFQYFPDEEYANKVIAEMHRVSRRILFIGDLKKSKTRDEHFVYPSEKFSTLGFTVCECFYSSDDAERYNVYKTTNRESRGIK